MTNFSANFNELYVRGNNSRILTNFKMGMNERNNYDVNPSQRQSMHSALSW